MEWRNIPGFENYLISENGSVKRAVKACNSKAGKVLKPYIKKTGYQEYGLCKGGKSYSLLTHRLVAITFLGEGAPGFEVCHNDGNKLNNHYSNLRWDTHQENCKDIARHGFSRGENSSNAKLNDEKVRQIKKLKKQGKTSKEIAALYGVGVRLITDVIGGYKWAHVK